MSEPLIDGYPASYYRAAASCPENPDGDEHCGCWQEPGDYCCWLCGSNEFERRP